MRKYEDLDRIITLIREFDFDKNSNLDFDELMVAIIERFYSDEYIKKSSVIDYLTELENDIIEGNMDEFDSPEELVDTIIEVFDEA